jgi:hypothetical protein
METTPYIGSAMEQRDDGMGEWVNVDYVRPLFRRIAELEARLDDALSGLEYIRCRYGALEGVGWNRLGFLEGKPRPKAEGPERSSPGIRGRHKPRSTDS